MGDNDDAWNNEMSDFDSSMSGKGAISHLFSFSIMIISYCLYSWCGCGVIAVCV